MRRIQRKAANQIMKSRADQRSKTAVDQRSKTAVDQRHPWLRIPDLIAIGVIALIAAGAAAVSMIESYTNLLDFAKNHHLQHWRAGIAPGAVDSFIVIGELLLFVAVYRGWNQAREYRGKIVPASMVMYGWALALFGFTLSVLGNLGSRTSADVITRLMSAVFPVSATVALAAGLMILKRVAQDYRTQSRPDTRPHGELLYLLGGFTPRREPEPQITASRRGRPKKEPLPQVQNEPEPAVLLPARPRIVPDPAPRIGQVSRPIEITDAAWAALESGVPAEKLATMHPELGSRARVKQIVDAHRAGRLAPGAEQVVDDAPVVWANGQEDEAASGE